MIFLLKGRQKHTRYLKKTTNRETCLQVFTCGQHKRNYESYLLLNSTASTIFMNGVKTVKNQVDKFQVRKVDNFLLKPL